MTKSPTPTDPNRFAGPAEAALLRDDIAADTAILTTVATRVAASKATLHAAERAFQEAKEQLEAAQQSYAAQQSDHASKAERLHVMRGRLQPIRRLPAEVLGEIFEAYLRAEGAEGESATDSDEQWHRLSLAPNAVAQVSRRWHRAACDTPRLWRYVSVRFRELADPESADGDPEWTAFLTTRIARAGIAATRLLIRGPFPDYNARYLDEVPGYEPAEWIGQRHMWEPIIAMVPRCQAIRVVIPSTDVSFTRMGPLLQSDAPALEELALCLCPLPDSFGFSNASNPPSPDIVLNLRAQKLRRVTLQGVLPRVLDLRGTFVYPRVTHASIAVNADFRREHLKALVRRLPALSHLSLSQFAIPRDLSLEWLAHANVRHIALSGPDPWLRDAGLAGPETLPALEAADIVRSTTMPVLTTALAATGPLHAVRRLSLTVQFLDAELVRALDLLPRLDTVLLRGGTLARSFVEDDTWIRPPAASRTWRCPVLQEMRLTGAREIAPVPPQTILTWLSSRNSSSGAGTHRAIRTFQVGWESLTWSQAQLDDFEDKIEHLLEK